MLTAELGVSVVLCQLIACQYEWPSICLVFADLLSSSVVRCLLRVQQKERFLLSIQRTTRTFRMMPGVCVN